MAFGAFDNPDRDESIRIVHRVFGAGITFVDSTDPYSGGGSERTVGKALADGRRESVVLATKLGLPFGEALNLQRKKSPGYAIGQPHRGTAGAPPGERQYQVERD